MLPVSMYRRFQCGVLVILLLMPFSLRADYGEWLEGLTEGQFNGLSDSQMYDAAEYFRLSKKYRQARTAYEILLGRNINEEYSDYSRLELGKLGLIVGKGFAESISYFENLRDNSQVQEYRDEAQYYIQALTNPTAVDDIALLTEINSQYITGQTDTSINVPNHWFVSRIIERCFKSSETLELIQNSEMSLEEKSSLIAHGAVGCFWAGNSPLAVELCDVVLGDESYAQLSEIQCYLHFLKGHILAQQFEQREAGIEWLEAGANNYPNAEFADRCLYRAGLNSLHLHNDADAKYYFQRVINNYSGSYYYDTCVQLIATHLEEVELSEAQLEKLGGAVREAKAGPQWELDAERQELIKGAGMTAPAGLRRYCGPVVLAEALRLKGEELSYEEAYRLCKPDKKGFTTMSSLVAALKDKGHEVKALEIGLKNLRPYFDSHIAILHLGDHFAVLREIGESQYTLFDDRGEIRLSQKRFNHLWDGYVILVEKDQKE